MKNPCLEAALSELAKVGIRDVQHSYGGKHWQIRFKVNGSITERMVVLPATPSDWRSASNTRALVRRILRADGMLTEPKPPAPPKPPNQVELLKRQIKMLEERNAALEQRLAVLEQNPISGATAP